MAEMAPDDLEESIFSGFQALCVRDHETGESVCLKLDEETGETLPMTYSVAISTPRARGRSGFRVPCELSKLGTIVKKEICKDTIPEDEVKVTSATVLKDSTSSIGQTVVTEVSNCKLSEYFCRKRKSTAEMEGKTGGSEAANSCEVGKLPRFLKGREGLLWAVQFFLVSLSLVSPGFFFPLIFIIKMMCHYRQHDESPNLDFSYRHENYLKCYLVRMCCRVCREQRITNKMLRVHSSLTKTEKKSAAGNTCPCNENCNICA